MKRNVDIAALIILIVSAVNCGLIGIFQQDVFTWLFGGQDVLSSRIVYIIVAAAGIWCMNLLLSQRKTRTGIQIEKKA